MSLDMGDLLGRADNEKLATGQERKEISFSLMRSITAEVEVCLPFFTRLCVNSVVATGVTLDVAAQQVAREIYGRIPGSMPADFSTHFTQALEILVELVSSLATRLPPQLISDYSARTSTFQVSDTLKNSILKAMSDLSAPSEKSPTRTLANQRCKLGLLLAGRSGLRRCCLALLRFSRRGTRSLALSNRGRATKP